MDQELLTELGITDHVRPEEVRKLLLAELAQEQPLAGEGGSKRFYLLVKALEGLSEADDRMALVPLRSGDIVDLVKSVEATNALAARTASEDADHRALADDLETERMRFRSRVTLPVGTVGAGVAFFWTNQDRLLGSSPSTVIEMAYLTGLGTLAAIWFLARWRQSRKESALEGMQRRELQDEALRRVVREHGQVFMADQFSESLAELIGLGAPLSIDHLSATMRGALMRTTDAALGRMEMDGWVSERVDAEFRRSFEVRSQRRSVDSGEQTRDG